MNLFERARQALISQLQLAPTVAEVLGAPSPTTSAMAPGATSPVAVQLTMNDRTQRVMVRLIDARTGAVVCEMSSTSLVVVAARIGRVVHDRSAKALMR
ncbi:MAG: hypothetical protein AUH31_04275 [Armatimonadetes bacterium 13_1_40CM_64_14]|nr:MAG: hypothetical protein AUH31_04275 [Armatimonadetes bacterium 13_1_40CM_64_14]